MFAGWLSPPAFLVFRSCFVGVFFCVVSFLFDELFHHGGDAFVVRLIVVGLACVAAVPGDAATSASSSVVSVRGVVGIVCWIWWFRTISGEVFCGVAIPACFGVLRIVVSSVVFEVVLASAPASA